MRRVPLSEFASSYRATVLQLLARSRFAHPSRWKDAIVVVTPERREALHRLEFAAELRSAGLDDDAHTIADEVLRAGEVIGYVLRDDAAACAYAAAVLVLPGYRRRA